MTIIDKPASADLPMREYTYNLFHNNERPKLLCAVPEQYPVPSFIVAHGWAFEGVLRSRDALPPGFHNKAARADVRYNGFYLFHAMDRERSMEQPVDSNCGIECAEATA